MDKMISRKNQLIMEAVSASEKATIQFRQYAAATLPPKFNACVLVYEHIYDLSRVYRFIDHDNMELKHCQDVLEAAFLVNDTSERCAAFQCSHRGEQDSTRIWILTPTQFPEWLKNYPECWPGNPENVQE